MPYLIYLEREALGSADFLSALPFGQCFDTAVTTGGLPEMVAVVTGLSISRRQVCMRGPSLALRVPIVRRA